MTFGIVTPYSLVCGYQSFRGKHRFCLQSTSENVHFQPKYGGDMFLRNVVNLLQENTALQPRIPQSIDMKVACLSQLEHLHRCENLKSQLQNRFVNRTLALELQDSFIR
jgi:hypothetical protein